MSKKPDSFQPKISRNDRFAQMSHQEKIIEQKKREIQAKLDAKEKAKEKAKAEAKSKTSESTSKQVAVKSPSITQKEVKNAFSNDGSFLDQFKQLKGSKKIDSKLKSFNRSKDHHDKNYGGEDRNKLRWAPRRKSPSPDPGKEKQKRVSRFSSEKVINFEPKITINASFSNVISQQNYQQHANRVPIVPQTVTGQPLLKNMAPPPQITYPNIPQNPASLCSSESVISAPPVLLNVPPPQISNNIVLNSVPATQNVLVSAPIQPNLQPPLLTTVSLPPPTLNEVSSIPVSAPLALPVPPPVLQNSVELSSIPPPNPIQLQNIPQPEPLNALTIPQPAPIQVQNIPTPNTMQLNEIPNPKPLDLLAIPTPNEEKTISDADFIKNIPPPNKSVPPPQITDVNAQCMPQGLMAAQATISVQNIVPSQNIIVHNVPPPGHQLQTAFSSVAVALPVQVVQVSSAPTIANAIPSLMAQPILPPPSMGVNVNVSCPPPVLQPSGATFVNQPPPITNQMPPMNVPPPTSVQMIGNVNMGVLPTFKDMNAVFPPGTPDYEAMASLGRMVAECGQGIEDIVRQRKNQDPSLWFLFRKDSAAYHQYQSLIRQFKREIEIKKEQDIKPKVEDMYEPEGILADDETTNFKVEFKQEPQDDSKSDIMEKKRKRRSRWGDNDAGIPQPTVIGLASQQSVKPMGINSQISQEPVMLSKITRTDMGLLQYAINTYGTKNLTEEDWKKAEDHYKISLLYQDMVKKREELERMKLAGKNKYDYDSDEETDGGTWEHRLRDKEMMATELWAQELTRQAEGKHHIGDFLPPEEFKRFMEKSSADKEGRQLNFSDYKEFKIKEDNIGFKMLQKLGWMEGEGLGSNGTGIVEPVNKAASREHTQGLGLNQSEEDEDEYESYRKRMMLAYRFRPNPLNNPRRPYY